MPVRQDNVQIRIDFITDEAKKFAGLISDTKKFSHGIDAAQANIKKLENEIAKLAEEGKDTTKVQEELARATKKLETNLQGVVDKARKFEAVDMSKLMPTQLIVRARQLEQALSVIPPHFRAADAGAKAIEVELSAINKQLAANKVRVVSFSQAMQDLKPQSTATFTAFTTFLATTAAGFLSLRELGRKLFLASEVASEIEGTRLALETIIGSKRQADKVVKDILVLAAKSPFETQELTEFTKRLLAMGVETAKAIPTMKALGDVAAGVGKEKLPQLVLAYGQVAAKTKLAGGELKQFVEAGVPLVAQLAKQFNTTEKEIYKMVENSQIGFKDVEKAFDQMTGAGGKFFGLMAKQSQTVTGLASTLKDNLTIALAAFGKGFNEEMKGILRSLISFSEGLNTDKLEAFGQSVGKAVKFVYEFGPAIVRLVSLYIGYQGAITAATFAQSLLNTTMTANPIGRIAAGLVVAANAAQYLVSKLSELTAEQTALNEVRNESNAIAKTEIKTSNELFAVIKEETIPRELRHKAFLKLKELYPDTLKNYRTEKELLGNLETAHRKVTERILEQAFAQAQAAKTSQITQDIIDLQIKKAEAEGKRASIKSSTEDVIDEATGAKIGTTGSNNIFAFDKEIDSYSQQIAQKIGLIKSVSDATNASFVEMANTLKGTSIAFNRFDAEISVLEKRTDKASKDRLEAVKKEKEAEIRDLLAGEAKVKVVREEIDEKAQKADTKKEKERIQRINEARNVELTSQENYYARELLANEVAELKNTITEETAAREALRLTQNKYAKLLEIQQKYLTYFKKNTEEYVKTETAMLELEKKKIETEAKLASSIAPTIGTIQGGVKRDESELIQEDTEALKKAVIIQKFKHILTAQQDFQIHQLEIQSNGYARQLENLKENGKKETHEYKAIAKQKQAIDHEISRSKKQLTEEEETREKNKQAMLASGMSFARDVFDFEIDLLSKDAEQRKKNERQIKDLQKAKVVVSGITEVAKIWETYAGQPWIAGALTAFAAGRTIIAAAKIENQKFAKGGIMQMVGGKPHSEGGTKGYFEDGTQVEVEKGEVLAVVNKYNAPMLSMLSRVNALNGKGVPFFAQGGIGFPNTTPSASLFYPPRHSVYLPATPTATGGQDNKLMDVLVAELRSLKASVEKNREVKFFRDQLADAYTSDDEDRKHAAWHL